MNKLTEFLVNSILEEENKEIVAIYGGGFKPPTTGHLAVVEQALKQYPEISKFLIYVGSGVRDEIDQEEALLVWEIYKKYLPTKVEIIAAKKPPIQEIYSYAKEHPEQSVYWIIGAREGREDDLEDIKQRTAALDKKQDKYGNVEVKVMSTPNADMSGTNARKALLSTDKFQFFKFIPDKLTDDEKEEIFTILRPAVTEKKDPKKGTGKKPKGSGRRLYTDEDPSDTVGVKFSSRQDIVDTLNKKSFKAKSHARQSQIINLIHQRVRAAYNRAKDPDVKKRLKTALDYAEQRKEASKAKTQRLKKQKLNEHSMGDSIDLLPYLSKLTQHMIDKGYNIEPLPGLKLIDDDFENAEDFFGKTAYYDPVGQIIVLYTHGRHPKDIARSYAHEMIHHIQNLEDRLGNITTTNTQEDDHLNDIEAEANLKGTMTFRNWTDSLNEIGDASAGAFPYNKSRIDIIVNTLKDKIEDQPDAKWRQHLLPFLKFSSPNADYEVITTAQVDKPLNIPDFQTRPNLIDLRVDFMVGESDEATNIGEQYKVMATMTQIIKELIDKISKLEGSKLHSVRIFPKSDDESEEADVNSKRGKLYQAYVKKNLPSGWDMSTGKDARGGSIVLYPPLEEGFDKKLGKDPFGLNAYALELARGLEEVILNEGRYDKFVNEISRIVFEMFKDIHDRGDKKGEFEFRVGDPDDEETDIPSKDFEFDLAGVVKITDDLYKVDGGANAGFDDDGEEIQPLLSVKFHIPKNPDWQKVSFDIKDVVRHELEHLTQDGENVKGVVVDPKDSRLDRPGKQMDDDQFIRDMIDADLLPKADYFKLEKEIDAMMQGLYFKAKKSRRPFKDVIDDYLATQPISQEEKEVILNLWRSRNKALNLPVFENEEKVMNPKIYLDMDGVLADFDQRFEDLSGMPPREFENKFGKNEFWDFIDEKHKLKFWIGIPVMDGAKKLVDFASKYDYELLTAPSAKKQSRIGKILWVRNHTKDLFGTTPFINFKKAKEKHEIKSSLTKSDILIDDRDDTIQRWNAAGGTGILYTSANQVINDLKKLGL